MINYLTSKMSQSFDSIVNNMMANMAEFMAETKKKHLISISDAIKCEVAAAVNGEAMYDYSQINKYRMDDKETTDKLLRDKLARYRYSKLELNQSRCTKEQRDEYAVISTLLENEVGIAYIKYPSETRNSDQKTYLIITNYSRVISWFGNDINSMIYIDAHNFWLPLDYIRIISAITKSSRRVFGNLLQDIKNQFYNRTFVPLYAKDIVAENNELKSKYAQYELDKAALNCAELEYIDKMAALQQELQPYINVQCVSENNAARTTELNKRERDLITMARRLKLERADLDAERLKLEAISLDDIINQKYSRLVE